MIEHVRRLAAPSDTRRENLPGAQFTSGMCHRQCEAGGVQLLFSSMRDAAAMLLYVGEDADESTDEHEGYVAVRGSDGSLSSIWADPQRDVGVAFVPRCECGWTGPDLPLSAEGHAAARRRWYEDHLQPFLRTRSPGYPADGPDVIVGHYVPER